VLFFYEASNGKIFEKKNIPAMELFFSAYMIFFARFVVSLENKAKKKLKRYMKKFYCILSKHWVKLLWNEEKNTINF